MGGVVGGHSFNTVRGAPVDEVLGYEIRGCMVGVRRVWCLDAVGHVVLIVKG
jgi:hypothetical protein